MRRFLTAMVAIRDGADRPAGNNRVTEDILETEARSRRTDLL
jgi:hypothetical protein